MTTNVVSPDMLSALCARGRSAGRLSRILVRCRRRRRFRVHNQTAVGDRSPRPRERNARTRSPPLNPTLNQRTLAFPSSFSSPTTTDVQSPTQSAYICSTPFKAEGYRDREGQDRAQHLLSLCNRSAFRGRPGESKSDIEGNGKGDEHLG